MNIVLQICIHGIFVPAIMLLQFLHRERHKYYLSILQNHKVNQGIITSRFFMGTSEIFELPYKG